MRLLGLGPLEDALAPDPDVIERSEARSSAPPSNDLFAPSTCRSPSSARATPPTHAGTSPTACGPPSDRDVLDAARAGVGPLRPLLDYLDGEAWASARPRAVVWEVPVRYLTDDAFLAPEATP